jgi:hypothetical protein
LDEALWEGSLDDSSYGFGDTDWEGYYARYDAPENETQLINEPGAARFVNIPSGYYVVRTDSAGWVETTRFDTHAEREAWLEPIERAYVEWETDPDY